MASYTVTHSCGHQQEHSLAGPHKDREQKLAWLETKPCRECQEAQRDQERAETAAQAAAANAKVGLPPLAGTERQIAWAEQIRADRLALWGASIQGRTSKWATLGIDRLRERMGAEKADKMMAVSNALGPLLIQRLNEVCQETSASWWIERRDQDAIEALDVPVMIAHPEIYEAMREVDPEATERRWGAIMQRQIKQAAEKAQESAKQDKVQEARRRIREALGEGVYLTVKCYGPKNTDRRVYCSDAGIAYYHDGNRYHSAGEGATDQTRELLEWLCRNWISLKVRT